MRRLMFSSLTLSLLLGAAGTALGNEKGVSFGLLQKADAEAARTQVTAWLKQSNKADSAKLDAIWKQSERTVIDRVADSIALGSPEAAALLRDARDPLAPAPTKLPVLLGKDSKLPAFARANLGLAYARALTNRKVFEEALAVLKGINPDQTADPAAHLFCRAVAEHALLQRPEATRTISQLLEEAVSIAPERYKTVSTLMLLDMHTWKDKDLGAVARKMENIERRLELARGGPQTQKLQKEVILRLDELIKEMENKAKKKQQASSGGGGDPNGGQCPSGSPSSGPPNGNNPSSPATQSGIATQGGKGTVEKAPVAKLASEWGRMPPRERARALQELTAGMSPRHREAIENYFRNLANTSKR